MAQLGGAPRRIRKFYKAVCVEETANGHALLLDGRAAKTPAGAALVLPTAALAEAVAEEWRAGSEALDREAMALTRLASTAIDLSGRDRARWTDDILNYLQTDLLCYRASEPAALVERQRAAWDPLLDWAAGELGARLAVTSGVAAIAQSDAVLASARRRIEAMDAWRIAGLAEAVPIAGSAVIGFALAVRAFLAPALFDASRLDEHFQTERWGADEEAAAGERRLEAAFLAVDRWFGLLGRPLSLP